MNKHMEKADPTVVPQNAAPPALLFEMLRSFVVLSETLNLSHAVAQLGSTRQTVRRHISALEEIKGGALFDVVDRRYALSALGEQILPEARHMVATATAWHNGNAGRVEGLQYIKQLDPTGWKYAQQQQPISHVWGLSSDLLRDSITAWSESGGQLEAPEMQRIRPHILVYRYTPHGWICVEIGEESFYAVWWGWTNARSSIGHNLGNLPGGPAFESLINQSFEEVKETSGLRLDEVVTQIPRMPDTPPQPLAYQRLLLGARFPDESFALITVVDRCEKIRIQGMDQSVLERMPADAKVAYRR